MINKMFIFRESEMLLLALFLAEFCGKRASVLFILNYMLSYDKNTGSSSKLSCDTYTYFYAKW